MVSLSYAVSNQIRLLVTNLNKKSYKTSTGELKDLARLYGDDARLCLLLCLVEEIDFHDPQNQKDQYKVALLLQELGELSSQPNFTSIVCRALHSSVLANDFFGSFVKVAKLPFSQALLIALGLVESADKKQKDEGLKFLKAKMQDMTEFNSEQLSENVLSQLIYFVRETEEIPGKQKLSFLTALEQLNPKRFAMASLTPVVRDEPEVSDVNALPNSDAVFPLVSSLQSQCRAAALMQDLGFGVCETVDSFKEFLTPFTLTSHNVAEMILAMARTNDHQGPEDDALLSGILSSSSADASELTLEPNDSKVSESKRLETHWNTDVFVQTITELYPSLNWLEVFSSFDTVLEPDQAQFCIDLATALSALNLLDLESWLQAQVLDQNKEPSIEGVNIEGVNIEDVNIENANAESVNMESVNIESVTIEESANETANIEGVNSLIDGDVPRPPEGSQSQDAPKPLNGPEIAERIASDTVKDRPPGPASFGSALNIDTLLSVERTGPVPTAPSEAIKDKIHFIINNVSKSNLKMKADKLKEILGEELFPYFSRYLVVKRISIEANFQKLYAQFLDVVNVPKLDKQLVETTYEYIKVLLNSEKILTSSSERSLLKNLGSWLGLLTIGKNKPLRANKLNLKELVLQAYEAGRLIAVVPFGAKVLEACSTSKVFKPPNPWLMALVSLLKEIFDLPDLKLNLKFEIEVLFNNLSIKIKDVKPSALLNDRIVKRNMHQNFPVQLAPEVGVIPEEPTRLTGGRSYTGQQTGIDENQPNYSTEAPSILPAYVTIHPSIALFSMYPHLKRCVPTAIDRAIRDIITPVVERSVTIACVTTRELIMKDFAMEPDENKVRKAAHQMVQKLTSSLAEVTCKEPLRVSINNHLSSLLEANSNSNERTLVDHACTQVSSDNLELGINLIEKAASDRAVREIEESLAPLFLLRSKHREQTGQPYYDVSIFAGTGRFPSALPDALRPKPGGLSAAQLRVYDDFSTPPTIPPASSKPDQKIAGEVAADFPRQNPPARTGPEAIPPPTLQPRIPSNPPGLPAPAASGSGSAPLTSQQTLDKLIGCLASLEQAVSRFANHKNTLLPSLRADHEIIVLLRMIPSILGQCPKDEATFPRDVVAFTFAHKVFKRLYERDNRHSLLQVDVHIQILRCIRQLCPKIVKELTSWLLFSDDERKYLIQITTGLLRARMLHIPEVDLYLAKLVVTVHASGQALQTRNLSPTLHPHLEFVINLVRRTVVKEPILAMQELSHLFDALTKMQTVSQRRNKPVAEVLAHLMESVRLAATANVPVAEDPGAAPASFPSTPSSAGTSPPALAREASQDQRPDMKDVDEATSQLYFEEAAMDRLPWDDDPPNFRQQLVYLLEDWMNICMQGTASDKTYAQYLAVLQQQRVLATADSTSRFFLILTQLCVDRAYASSSFSEDLEAAGAAKSGGAPGIPLNASQQQYATSMTQQAQQPAQLSYTAIDALAKLVVFLVKFFAGEGTSPSNPNAPKIRMLNAFLRSACRVLRRDFDLSGRAVRTGKGTATFNQRPYFRLFANLLHHLNTPDPSLDSNNVEVVAAFGQCFRLLRPSRVPSFCFAWLELISHRMFMSKLLISKSTQCAMLFEHLLVDLLEFMQPYLRNAELTDSVRLLYKGALRVLLVLLHDFPEFLCDFHFSFCDVIPITCVQMRNLILSAFPRSMRLPDPFTPNLKVDLLPDITQSPRLLSDITSQLNRHRQALMQPLESYLAKRSPPAFLTQIRQTLLLNAAQAKKTGTKYNVPLINSLVLYVGCQGITKLQAKTGAQFQDNACMDVFEALVTTLDAEGRYYVLNAIANQLRYPNNHTHYFSCVLLYLFLQSKQSVIMEQITRVLLERLIVHRPHPWGLLITFIELIKNPRYSFWKRAFTRCAPEIERLFDSVARSCMPSQKTAPPSTLPPGAQQQQQHPGLTQHPQQPQQPQQQQHTYNSVPRPPTM